MSIFDLEKSFARAAERFGARTEKVRRRRRSDAGKHRLAPNVEAELRRLLSGQERVPMRRLLDDLKRFCQGAGQRAPSRASVYLLMAKLRSQTRSVGDLPPWVRGALYNFDDESLVPEAQIAFYCFNYGDLRAMSYAAGLPWLALYQAVRTPGWRPKSRGVALAVLRVRGI